LIVQKNRDLSAYKASESQVRIQIINNAFRIVQRATAQKITGKVHGSGVAEAPPVFQAC
jgi:hypothetical protein